MDYSDFCTSVRFSLFWNSLKYKHEYKINSSEFSLYQLLADETYLLALNLKLNFKLCEALSYIHSFLFIDNGYASYNALNDYLKENNINVDLEKIKKEIIIEKIRPIKGNPDEKFFGYVDELLFSTSKTKEVKLVKECYRIIKTLQPLKNKDATKYFDLVASAIEELKEKAIENDEIVSIDLEKYIPSDMEKFVYELSSSDRKDFYEIISNDIKEDKNEKIEKVIKKLISHLTVL